MIIDNYDKLIAVYDNPREIIEYRHPKDPAGSTLTHIWRSDRYLSEDEFKSLLNGKKIVKLSDDNGNGLSEAEACYYYLEDKLSKVGKKE